MSRKFTGRVLPHPEDGNAQCFIGRGWVTTPDGKGYAYDESPSPAYVFEKTGITQTFSPTEVKNYEVQGLGAEIAKAAMAVVMKDVYRRKDWAGKVLLVNQVHDAIYLDVHPDYLKAAAEVLHRSMVEATQAFRDMVGWNVPIDVPAETTYGACMAVEKPFTVTNPI
jgi:hypothetical protein